MNHFIIDSELEKGRGPDKKPRKSKKQRIQDLKDWADSEPKYRVKPKPSIGEEIKKGVFRIRRPKMMGEEESKRARKERSQTGEWTPSQKRMSERAKQRREDYGGGEE
jgi:hypothetical protein